MILFGAAHLCQSHSKMMRATRHTINTYPDLRLYEEILLLKYFFKGNWVVENVAPYYKTTHRTDR
jgi:DNA (cytosine-5)-methyltransferase 1